MAKREIVQEDIARVKKLLGEVIGKADCVSLERMGGLTNRTYHAMMESGEEYVVRIPGEGTETLINRSDEKKSTSLACNIGIDAQCLYFGEDGAKVTEYIRGAVTMSADKLKEEHRIKQMAEIFKRLHTCGGDTGVPFEVFAMADGYKKIIADMNEPMFVDYPAVEEEVAKIKAETDKLFEQTSVPCHNDPLCENWIVDEKDDMFLIDWEYAGMNDGMWDLADVSIEANFQAEQDEKLLRFYLGKTLDENDLKHFLAAKIYVDYLWTLWAKARAPYDGQSMEDWALERYLRLKNNIANFKKI